MKSRMKPSPSSPEIGGINIIPKLVGLLLALPPIIPSVDALFFGEEHTKNFLVKSFGRPTLWWTNIAMENHHFSWENPL